VSLLTRFTCGSPAGLRAENPPIARKWQYQQIRCHLDCHLPLNLAQASLILSFLLFLSSGLPLIARASRFDLLPQNTAQPSEEDQKKYFAMMGEILDMASKGRSTPITEPGIPTEQVNGDWRIRFLKLTSDVIVGTYELAPQYKFYVQASICALKDKPAKYFDPTILGEHETAAAFYRANSSFIGSNEIDYVLCEPPGVNLQSKPRPTDTNQKTVLMTSEERVLRHMSNWLLFLAEYNSDQRRSSDFLPFILDRYRLLLLATNEDGDKKELVSKIKFYDRTFPFEVFEQNIPLSADGRAQVREFFKTLLFMCNKLKALSPDAATQIPRAERLLKRFQ
jgi:hypothetical protein